MTYDCTCKGPARDAHDPQCPIRIRNPRFDLGDRARLCTARVWASGDMENCGRQTVVADRCEEHRQDELHSKRLKLAELHLTAEKLRERIALLDDENTDTLVALRHGFGIRVPRT